MKQRFSSLDVKVIAHELSNTLVPLRVNNIYDLSSKIFLFKFQNPERKEQIVIDSGFRVHLTEFSRATAAAPSPFVAKLRKALKTRRVTSVAQIGTDRIIEFQFSDGLYKLYLEFYAGGNIILTDKDLNILNLLRIVPLGQGEDEQRIGLKYNLENRQGYGGIPDLTKERLQEALRKAADKDQNAEVVQKKGRRAADSLRRALAVSITEYPPMLVDHAMRVTDFDSTLKPADIMENDGLLDHLLRSLEEAQRVIKEITSSEVAKGYIIAKKKDNYEEVAAEDARKGVIYDDFHPFRPKQFEDIEGSTFLEFQGFNKTVDEFFSSIEGQRLSSRLEERELMAKKKIEAARQDQAKRLGGLQDVQELNQRKASALQVNAERVQETMDAVNGLIAQGKDWVEIGQLIEIEQRRNNPVAALIKLPLKLEENTITILLDEEDFTSDDEADETDVESDSEREDDEAPKKPNAKGKLEEKRLVIDIDLALSPWANAREYFDQRRSAAEKQQKTLQSSTKALRSQEQKIAHDLKKGLKQEKAVLRPVRRQLWFEKFTWFVSSDGYLVLAGKDALQNEILYKKYLKKGDVFVHADVQGAATVVIRNNPKTPDAPVPPSTLSQAGTLAVSCSSAWDSKAGMSAWWVKAEQVSKSAFEGDFLPPGIFSIKGTKNFLPPAVLLMGFGLLFQISEESKARHNKHRHQDVEEESSTTDATSVADTETSLVDGKEEERDSDIDDNHVSEGDAVDQSESEQDPVSDEEDSSKPANPLQSQEVNVTDPEYLKETSEQVERLHIDEANESAQPSKELESDDESANASKPATGTQTPLKKGPTPLPRGKRAKAKRAAQKYKDQDESDRLAAQELLGAPAAQAKNVSAALEKESKEKEAAFQKERRRAQHLKTQTETAENEAKRKALFESAETDELDVEEEFKQVETLEYLVGVALKGDEIIDAIPVCAPWAAMGKYKYKVKLQPGAVKKGKAVKEILSKWTFDAKGKAIDEKSEDPERMWPKEVEIIKGLRAEEVTNIVPVGKVRVMMSGGSAGVQKKTGGGGGGGRGGRGGKKR